MNWRITEKNAIDAQAVDRLGNKLLIGNGYLGYRGTLEEYTKDQKTATIINGLYDKVGDKWREPVNAPNGLYVQLTVEGAPLHAQFSEMDGHSQTLDMQRGIHERATSFVTAEGMHITVNARRFASLASHHLLCLEYSLEASEDCTITLRTGIDGDIWDLNGPHLCNFKTTQHDALITMSAFTHEQQVPLAMAEIALHRGTESVLQADNRIIREIEIVLKAGQPTSMTKFVAIYSGLDSNTPLEDAEALTQTAAAVGFEGLLEEHTTLWRNRWDACDIEIGGDPDAETALRFSMYHLLAIAPAHSDKVSIPARGLSGQVYKGGIFWDTEIFMLPFFTYTFPQIARNLLMYRFHTLDGARRKAAEYGFRGAFYAWESQDTGDDACTLFNITDVFTNRPMRTYFRDKQVHISADVVYAIWDYISVTQDDTILLDGCAEVIFECARFLLSYLYYRKDKDRYEVLDVTGPDEYHERVHNDTYTNAMVAHTFNVCLQAARHLQTHHASFATSLIEKLDFAHDLDAIREASEKLYVPQPDAESGIIPQFDGYLDLEDVPLGDLLLRKLHPYEYLGGGNGLATTTQIIKQADVVLALHLFPDRCDQHITAANWNYYEPRTEHGSSLSACAYALVAAQIGKIEWAYKYFMKTATIDLTGSSKQYVGTLYIGGTHPAANGGAWMAAVFGMCGLRLSNNDLRVVPQLPAHWTEVSIRLIYRGQRQLVKITKNDVMILNSERVMEAIGRP